MPRASESLWTYGCEHEFSDWSVERGLPEGFARSPDYTIVNSNGIAAQPNPKVYPYGGEINTPPTSNPGGQIDCLHKILNLHTECQINHRSNLHVHIRVPGLKDDLQLLKQVQLYIHTHLPKVINLLEPIPVGYTLAEKKREKRRKVSHHTFLTPVRLKYQLQAKTIREFFEKEVPHTNLGVPMWHAQPRLAVGLRQLLQTDTIEFRHFPGTLDYHELNTSISWCRQFLRWAIKGFDFDELWGEWKDCSNFPKFPPFDYEKEVGYQATASHNGLSQDQIKQNIQLILRGRFHASHAYKEASKRACGVSRKHLP